MRRSSRWIGLLLLGMALSLLVGCSDDDDGKAIRLTIAHVNDTHSHLEDTNTSLTINGIATYMDVGGYARLATKMKSLRQEKENVLLLHAGDAVQGTLYFTKYHGEADFAFWNLLNTDVMVLGNHEFDNGPATTASFFGMAKFPLVSANVDASADPDLKGQIASYVIKEFNGEKVGIVGLTLEDTAVISNPGDTVAFKNAVDTATKMVAHLEGEEDVNKIIFLTHMGYEADIALVQAVNGIDIIVGGHSHSLLGDTADLGLTAVGPYPTTAKNPSGETVYIVQDWQWAYGVGLFTVDFDEDGHVKSASGSPVLLVGDNFQQKDASGAKVAVDDATRAAITATIATHPAIEVVAEDADALALLAGYKTGVDEFGSEKIGIAAENLLHVREPGTHTSGEVLANGSHVAPHVCEGMVWKANSVGLNVDLSLQNAGGVRIDVPAGDITIGTAYTLLPFGNTLFVLDVTGAELKAALENGLTRKSGAFPYLGHARYTANATYPEGSRLVSLEIKQADGSWKAVENTATYRVVTNNYVAGGGDGYTSLKNATGYRYDTGFVDAEAFVDYVKHMKTLSRPASTGVTYLTTPAGARP